MTASTNGDPIRLFEEMTKKTRTTWLVAGVLLVLISLPLVVLPLFVEAKLGELLFLGGLGLTGVGIGGYALYRAVQVWDPSRAPVVRLLRDSPQSVVWVYEHRMVVNGVPRYNVYLNCRDGKRLEFNLGGTDPGPLLATLSAHLPHARFGYDKELNARYKSSPASFA